MNHFRYVYYRKQGYRRISPSAICFVSTFIKHSGHFCHELLDNLFMAVSHVKCNKCLAYGFITCWKSYCLHRNYILDLHEKRAWEPVLQPLYEGDTDLYAVFFKLHCCSTKDYYMVVYRFTCYRFKLL